MISEKLLYLRKISNISQSILAKKIGVSQKAIDFWEKGANEPKSSYIIKLADFFNVSTDYLLGREEEDGRIIIQELELPSDERNMLNDYRELPEELKANCREYIRTIKRLNEKDDQANTNIS